MALAQLGAARRIEAVEAGAERFSAFATSSAPDAVLIGTRDELDGGLELTARRYCSARWYTRTPRCTASLAPDRITRSHQAP